MEAPRRSLAVDAQALTGRREVKVKLPASHVLRLYYLKLTSNLNYSDVVEDALGRYFDELDGERKQLRAGQLSGSFDSSTRQQD